jgi:hypothetical protein
MQLIPRYLVEDRIKVISNDIGFIVEYRPVYSRQLKVYRGIDNKLQFRLLNADQKPIQITPAISTPWIVIFDEAKNKIIERECTVTDDDSTTRGLFDFSILENDLLNIKQQYLSYNIYMKNADNSNSVTYSDRNFSSSGTIFLDGNAYPGPKSSTEITDFYTTDDFWTAGSGGVDGGVEISAEPGLNGNEALHTVAIYSSLYVGNVEVQVTLDNQISGINNWATVNTVAFDGTETDPVAVNFNGIVSYLRFKFDADPTDKISKILVRN